jgi:hypothetical protein
VGLVYANEVEHGLFMLNYLWLHNDILNNNIKDRTKGLTNNNNIKDRTKGLTNNNIKVRRKGLTKSNSGTISGLKNNKIRKRGLTNNNINKILYFER